MTEKRILPPPETIFGLEYEYGSAWPSIFHSPNTRGVVRDSEWASTLFTNFLFFLFANKEIKSPVFFQTEQALDFLPITGYQNGGWFIPNGGRIYADLGHPEYATPECDNPLSATLYAEAGERLLEIFLRKLNRRLSQTSARELVSETSAGGNTRKMPALSPTIPEDDVTGPISIHRNNTDFSDHSYGLHENYLCERDKISIGIKSFDQKQIVLHRVGKLQTNLLPFLTTRQIFAGAGGFWKDEFSEEWHYVVSPRAMFIQTTVGSGNTSRRPCISLKDEPYAPDQYFRLHLVIGDSLMSDFATYLTVGTTSIVLSMIQDDFLSGQIVFASQKRTASTAAEEYGPDDFSVIKYLKDLSRGYLKNPELKIEIDGKGKLTALAIQKEYLNVAKKYFNEAREPLWWEKDIMEKWEMILNVIKNNSENAGRYLEYISKLNVLENLAAKYSGLPIEFIREKGLTDRIIWETKIRRRSSAKEEKLGNLLLCAGIQYTDISRPRSLYWKIVKAGKIERLFTSAEISYAIHYPPPTRALVRECAKLLMKKLGGSCGIANWDRLYICPKGTENDGHLLEDINPGGGENMLKELQRLISRINAAT